MKNLKTKLQSLRQKADQWKQVVESAPARAERLRAAVNTTAGQLQQLRAEVQGSVTALRMHDDTQLAATLLEINEHEATFLRAGYDLAGLDLEPGIAPRLLVHLDKLEDVGAATLRSVLNETSRNPAIHAIFSAIAKAEQVAAETRLTGLSYRKLIVHVGPAPTVRVCWRREDAEDEETVPVAKSASAAPAPPPLPGSPAPATASFFERPEPKPEPAPPSRPMVAAPVEPAPAPTSLPTPQPTRTIGSLRVAPISLSSPSSSSRPQREADTGGANRDSLERFKRMPDLTGRR